MTECQAKQIEKFLSDELTGDESSEFESHLENCPHCRQSLENFVSAPAEWDATRDLLCSSSDLPNWEQADDVSSVQSRELAPDLAILAPADDPRYVGRIGAYEVLGVIGRGGMGIVFKALDRALNRYVAIKILDPSLSSLDVARARFAREAKAMATISSEHVVPVFAVEEHRGLPFFAMEYVAGGTLESRLHRDGRLDLLAIVRISHQIAAALGAAHEQGLVHRDIKPANILLDRGIERVRVADFGLARVASEVSHTRSGMVAGTPQYMSPEQVRGDECDWHSDLFSLGCVMYAMCVGRSPFAAETPYGAMHRIVHDKPNPIREANPAIPSWLEQFILRLLEKTPSRRFESTRQVIDLLALELQELQRSSTSAKRHTWRRQYVHRDSRVFRRRSIAALLGVAAISAALLLAPWIGSSPQTNSSDLQQGPGSVQSHAPSEFPWNDDASLAPIRAGIDAVESDLRRNPQTEDEWRRSIDEIDADMRAILNSPF